MTATDAVYISVMVFALALGLLIIGFVSVTLTSHLANTTAFSADPYAKAAIEGTSHVTDKLDYLVMTVFLGMVLALIITSWYIGASPVFFFLYFVVILMGIVIGAILSNTWETVSTKALFSTVLGSFPMTNHILMYLPLYIAVVGFLGMTIMFAKPYGGQSQSEGKL